MDLTDHQEKLLKYEIENILLWFLQHFNLDCNIGNYKLLANFKIENKKIFVDVTDVTIVNK